MLTVMLDACRCRGELGSAPLPTPTCQHHFSETLYALIAESPHEEEHESLQYRTSPLHVTLQQITQTLTSLRSLQNPLCSLV